MCRREDASCKGKDGKLMLTGCLLDQLPYNGKQWVKIGKNSFQKQVQRAMMEEINGVAAEFLWTGMKTFQSGDLNPPVYVGAKSSSPVPRVGGLRGLQSLPPHL